MKVTFFISLIFFGSAFFGGLNTYASELPSQTESSLQGTRKADVETIITPIFSEEEFEAAFRRLKSQDQLQFELAGKPETPTFKWLQGFLEAIGRFLVLLSPFFVILFWGFVILLIGLLLYVIITSIRSFRVARRQRQEDDEEAYAYRPSQAQALILLQEVDALAAEGRYAKAVHQLLFRSIQDIGTAKPNMIRRSYTSREIADLSSLAPDTRQAFTLIAAEVERSYFGGQNLDKTAFEKCRAAYAELARPEKSEDTLPSLNGAMA